MIVFSQALCRLSESTLLNFCCNSKITHQNSNTSVLYYGMLEEAPLICELCSCLPIITCKLPSLMTAVLVKLSHKIQKDGETDSSFLALFSFKLLTGLVKVWILSLPKFMIDWNVRKLNEM